MTMNFNRNGGSGTSDYSQLSNKPQINGVTLSGNKTSADLGLMAEYEVDDTPTELSENLISSGAVWDKLQGAKQASSIGGTIEIPDYGMTESIEMYFKPSQDLHGYSKPWAGGTEKNKLNPVVTSQTIDGITVTKNNDGSYLCKGQATANVMLYFDTFETNGNSYILSGCPPTGSYSTYCLGVVDNGVDYGTGLTFSGSERPYIRIGNGYECPTDGLLFKPMIRLSTETDPTFEPYSNICPIVGQSEATFSWTDSQDIETARTMNFGNTYYGGVCHFDGILYPDWDYIASYNGETLTGEWLSDRDEYTAGTTPTNGAEVVYKTTPTQVRVTPPANLNLTDDYPIEYNGYMATINYQPKDTVLEEAKNYTNQEIAKLVPHVYSTLEEKVGAWIDGKPIYQITINCGLLWNSMTKTIDTQIVVDKVIKIDGVAISSTNIINLPHVGAGSGDGHVALNLNKDANNKLSISITSNSDRTSYTGYVTIQYTKLSN